MDFSSLRLPPPSSGFGLHPTTPVQPNATIMPIPSSNATPPGPFDTHHQQIDFSTANMSASGFFPTTSNQAQLGFQTPNMSASPYSPNTFNQQATLPTHNMTFPATMQQPQQIGFPAQTSTGAPAGPPMQQAVAGTSYDHGISEQTSDSEEDMIRSPSTSESDTYSSSDDSVLEFVSVTCRRGVVGDFKVNNEALNIITRIADSADHNRDFDCLDVDLTDFGISTRPFDPELENKNNTELKSLLGSQSSSGYSSARSCDSRMSAFSLDDTSDIRRNCKRYAVELEAKQTTFVEKSEHCAVKFSWQPSVS